MDNCGTDDNEEILILVIPITVPSEAQDLFDVNSVQCTVHSGKTMSLTINYDRCV